MHISEKGALLDALRHAVDAAGGLQSMAGLLDIEASTLAKQLRATDEDPQMGLFDALTILDRSKFPVPFLHALAKRYGFLLVPPVGTETGRLTPQIRSELPLSEVSLLAVSLASLSSADPSADSLREMETVVHRIAHAVKKLQDLLQRVRNLRTEMDTPDPSRLV